MLCSLHYSRARRAGSIGRVWKPSISCSVDGCESPLLARGMCSVHYQRWWRGISPGESSAECIKAECFATAFALELCREHYKLHLRATGQVACAVAGCAGVASKRRWCELHYARWKKDGEPGEAARRQVPPGTGHLNKDGYRQIQRDGRRVMEHRFVMEQRLGRELFADETVHHINGVRHDNRPENLELWSSSHPPGQRVDEKVEWALQMLARYAPDKLA